MLSNSHQKIDYSKLTDEELQQRLSKAKKSVEQWTIGEQKCSETVAKGGTILIPRYMHTTMKEDAELGIRLIEAEINKRSAENQIENKLTM